MFMNDMINTQMNTCGGNTFYIKIKLYIGQGGTKLTIFKSHYFSITNDQSTIIYPNQADIHFKFEYT